LVKFFGKQGRTTRAPSKEAPAKDNGARDAAPPGPPPGPPPAAEEPAKKTVRRRAPARPPRRDWAAEAAAAPLTQAAPPPSSLATSPAEEGEAAAGAPKRRRGTRGGRGRKKPGTALAPAEAAAPAPRPAARPAAPLTLDEVVARQADVLESFAHEVSATLKSLQASIADLHARVERPPIVTSNPRVGLFVDVPNLIYAAERRNITLDFGRVLEYFTRGRELVRATAYAPISDDPQAKLETQRFVHQFVAHPYRIVTKPLKRFADGSMKANFDIELAIDILTMSDRLDVVVLMSGDGDFRRVVELVASRGVRVEVVAFAEAASAELKTVADRYVDLGAHLDEFKALK
jgi:uncharacterized LabA/DUF88 family protein